MAIKPKMYFTSKADKTSQNCQVMDFVIGLHLDLNDVQNESLREWDSIMTIKKENRRPGRDSQCSSLIFSLFVFFLQKLVKESAHHPVVAALSAPPTQRAVSNPSPPPSTASAHPSISSYSGSSSLLFSFYYGNLSHTPQFPRLPLHYLPQYKIVSSTFHHNCHLLSYKTSNLSEQCAKKKKNKPIGSKLAGVIL